MIQGILLKCFRFDYSLRYAIIITVRSGCHEQANSKKEYVKEKRKNNILKQQFKANAPNRVWVSDVTVFSYGDYYYYICAIIDLFSRKVAALPLSIKN